ncbi:flagellar hook capping FlgD N-terminal domain-containing protein [uncultured Lentibacter sp.]|jgi:flagellar basal-body rod modification protein FlgD|uniref:flagellar hook assembly protein FlgD n=1 Tax=uncultured Lentibacter sp. TaxID=1659309 RepID=UPI00260D6692|nr:flagellar hook capping FlgD N-terminal domain-containing protein [uncultured Lentibacter sp.]
MSNIDSTGAAAQQAIFDKLGINTQKSAAERASDDKLGQDDFLQLMTAQLQNQDPFAPMENGDFIAQMAQFSTVSGIEEINTNLKSLSAEMSQTRIATASTLLGHSVLVPGSMARPDDNGEIHGVFELPQAASATRVSFTDATTGELLHSDDLGPQGTGLVGFSWTDIPTALREGNRKIKVDVAANTGAGMETMGPSIYARVLSASSYGEAENAPTLDVEDYGTIDASTVSRIR